MNHINQTVMVERKKLCNVKNKELVTLVKAKQRSCDLSNLHSIDLSDDTSQEVTPSRFHSSNTPFIDCTQYPIESANDDVVNRMGDGTIGPEHIDNSPEK